MNAHAVRLGMSGVVVALASATLASGAARGGLATSSNLIKNGNAEAGPAVNDDSSVVSTIPGWTKSGAFTVVTYGSPNGFPDASVSGSIHGGQKFFAGGPANPGSGATQDVSVAQFASAIDAGKMTAKLAGDLGGFSGQNDSLTVTATFEDGTGTALGTIRIGPVSAAQRNSTTNLLARANAGRVPKQIRSIHLAIHAVRTNGSYNDGYADNLSLTLTSS